MTNKRDKFNNNNNNNNNNRVIISYPIFVRTGLTPFHCICEPVFPYDDG
jgi:hypothetical protein